jgi:hypothetical protein
MLSLSIGFDGKWGYGVVIYNGLVKLFICKFFSKVCSSSIQP